MQPYFNLSSGKQLIFSSVLLWRPYKPKPYSWLEEQHAYNCPDAIVGGSAVLILTLSLGVVGAPEPLTLPKSPLHVPTLGQLDSAEPHVSQRGLYPIKFFFPDLSWNKAVGLNPKSC